MITGHTRVYAVLGAPVRHSRSPEIYNRLFAEHGVDAVYVALEVAPAAELVGAIRALGLAGANLTVPHKEAAVGALDEVTPAARAIGAVNVVWREGDRLLGDNTDADGFCDALAHEHAPGFAGLRVAIFGAGGAAAAVASGLARRGAASVALLNRTAGRAEALAERLGAVHRETGFSAGGLGGLRSDTDLVVNAAAGGADDALAGLDLAALPGGAIACDLNYWRAEPAWIAAARARGLRVQGGLPMLAWQAAYAFRRFTGLDVDPARVHATLR